MLKLNLVIIFMVHFQCRLVIKLSYHNDLLMITAHWWEFLQMDIFDKLRNVNNCKHGSVDYMMSPRPKVPQIYKADLSEYIIQYNIHIAKITKSKT